jgi:predicted dehydrogenase
MNKLYSWGIIGTGKISTFFCSALKTLKNASVSAVYSRDKQRAFEFSEKFQSKKHYTDFQQFLNDSSIDIVYIGSPNHCHYPQVIQSLNAGKHVLCEKPLAINAEQVSEMIAAAKRNNVFLMEALWTRFLPSFITCKNIIDNNTIGIIQTIDAELSFTIPFNRTGRHYSLDQGGGALLDLGIYPVFLALEIGGQPLNAAAQADFHLSGVDETCAMQFTHSNGCASILKSSFLYLGKNEAVITGTKGKVTLRNLWHKPTTIELFLFHNSNSKLYTSEPYINGLEYEAVEVMRCLDNGFMESPLFTLKKSQELATQLDAIREIIQLEYPATISGI